MESFARAGVTALLAAVTFSAPIAGTFALSGGTQHVSATMNVHRVASATTLDVVESSDATSKPISKYSSDMTKLMHMIVISDDFSQFMHLHPAFDPATGHFTASVKLDPARQYIVYADAEPDGAGQQVFRFLLPAQQRTPMVPAGQPTNRPISAVTPSPNMMSAGPYTVALKATTLAANAMLMVPLTIARNGKPANDLHPYLGAAAHAVFINTADLSYVHVHPFVKGTKMNMHMQGGQAGPNMMMHVPSLPVGTYKLWLQFRGGATLYTVPFTIAVR